MRDKFGWLLLVVVFGAITGFLTWRSGWFRHRPADEWAALDAASAMVDAVVQGNGSGLVSRIALPPNLVSRTEQEQSDFLLRALRDEVSIEGLAVMRREAKFGRLADVFPEEAQTWASNARVRVEDSIAFRLEKNGLRAEIAIVTNPIPRVIRINNVRQMALPPPPEE